MPGNLATVFNNGGVPIATSADEFYQRQNLANQNQSNENARLQAQLADAAANRALQLQMGGTYADRARQMADMQSAGFSHDTSIENLRGSNALALGKQGGEFNLAGIKEGNVPALAGLGFESQRYQDTRADNAPQRELNNAKTNVALNAIRGINQPSAARSIFDDLGPNPVPSAPGIDVIDYKNASTPFTNARPAVNGAGGTSSDEILRSVLNLPDNSNRDYERQQVVLNQRRAMLPKLLESSDPATHQLGLQWAAEMPEYQGVDKNLIAGAFKPDAAAGRAEADAKTTAYINSPIIQQRVSTLIPGLLESAKTDPAGIALAVSRAANALSVAAAKEGADAPSVTAAITKNLAASLAPELEKLRPGLGKKLIAFATNLVGGPAGGPLLQSLGETGARGLGYGPTSPQAADVLNTAKY